MYVKSQPILLNICSKYFSMFIKEKLENREKHNK